MYSINKFSKLLNVTPQTLRNWHKLGKLVPFTTSTNGYRYYSQEQLDLFKHNSSSLDKISNGSNNKIVIGYCRVSSSKQKDDLERQIQNVTSYMTIRGYQFEIVTDIGSGINYNNKGLNILLDRILNKEVSKIVVLYKDKLVRFGFDLIQNICNKNNVEIEIIDNTEKSQEQELVEDLIQIIESFDFKFQGKISYNYKQLLNDLRGIEVESIDLSCQ